MFMLFMLLFRVDERVVLMVGMFLNAFTYFVILPMANEPPEVITMSSELIASLCPAGDTHILTSVIHNGL